ncbi:hypothetical protein KKI24_22260 [bacterium]|nr:hypothetical protein [bacterium]
MELTLDLSKVCIETASKRAYNRRLLSYFKKNGDKALLELEIEMLLRFISETDFQALRDRSLDLCGGTDAVIVLKLSEEGTIGLYANGMEIERPSLPE